jgi:very-short-patch-repair endonuclease
LFIKTARALRRNQTDAETRLWRHLRDRRFLGLKFRRQAPVGRYVADFLCLDLMLIVELDGGQHAENSKDRERTRALEAKGYSVVRYWNNDVLSNTEGVLAHLSGIRERRRVSLPHPNPSPRGRGA